MPAYVISEVAFLDAELAGRYRALAQDSIARHGGRYLVRGGELEALEGDFPSDHQVVVVEFPTLQAARAWYGSAEYSEALALRDRALTRRLILVDGVD
jgi:uncharacterized protein (DUF1330 family)